MAAKPKKKESNADQVKVLAAQNKRIIRELTELKDRQAILDCVSTYAVALDRHDWPMLESVFHEDAMDFHGTFFGDVDDYMVWVKELMPAHYKAHTHNITTHKCEIEGNTAHAVSYAIYCSAT